MASVHVVLTCTHRVRCTYLTKIKKNNINILVRKVCRYDVTMDPHGHCHIAKYHFSMTNQNGCTSHIFWPILTRAGMGIKTQLLNSNFVFRKFLESFQEILINFWGLKTKALKLGSSVLFFP